MPEPTRRSGRGQASLWRVEAEQRVRTALRRYRRPLIGLVARAAYEGETRAFVRDFLTEALGFTTETLDRPPAAAVDADYALRVGTDVVALVEIRRVAARLPVSPNARVGPRTTAPWLVLTNAVEWHLYHLEALDSVSVPPTPLIRVDLLGPLPLARKAAALVHLTRESFEHGETDSLLVAQQALSPESLSAAVMSLGVLRAIQRELQRKTGQAIETRAIADAVRAILASRARE